MCERAHTRISMRFHNVLIFLPTVDVKLYTFQSFYKLYTYVLRPRDTLLQVKCVRASACKCAWPWCHDHYIDRHMYAYKCMHMHSCELE